MEYATEIFDIVGNPYYQYYKLSIEGVCQFDEFVEEVKKIAQESRSYEKILYLMDVMSPQLLSKLPKSKFRHIIPNNKKERADIYEFKHETSRVYVIFQNANIYIVRGGRKKSQSSDIAKVKRDTKDFNP